VALISERSQKRIGAEDAEGDARESVAVRACKERPRAETTRIGRVHLPTVSDGGGARGRVRPNSVTVWLATISSDLLRSLKLGYPYRESRPVGRG